MGVEILMLRLVITGPHLLLNNHLGYHPFLHGLVNTFNNFCFLVQQLLLQRTHGGVYEKRLLNYLNFICVPGNRFAHYFFPNTLYLYFAYTIF